MLTPLMIVRTWKAVRHELKAEREAKAAAQERAAIAKAFNDLFTYRTPYDESDKYLPGTGALGFTPKEGNAWMCPKCNKVHLAVACCAFTGLQYPACCSYPRGHRLYYGIRTK